MGSKNKSDKKAKQAKKAKEDAEYVEHRSRKGDLEAAKDPKGSSKKRPAPSPSEEPQPEPAVYKPDTSELEKKRLSVADELRKVEQQIFDLETKYLEQSSAFGNAVRGYEGFLGGVAQANRKILIKTEERLFSLSSSSTPHAT